MLLPRSVARIVLEGPASRGQGTVALRFTTLDDHGMTRTHTVSLGHTKDLAI